ncbi:PH domain-containing protein [Kocuria palustris]|uniref:PH domain-containing protein n=1 Tax=Kocuria palustris TaxID=71999 RepID=UPI0011A50CBC|nr:PH domain-containing protein [Kocuria palustris]
MSHEPAGAPRLSSEDPATLPPSGPEDGPWQGLHPRYLIVRLLSEAIGYAVLLAATVWPLILKLAGPWDGASWWAVLPWPTAALVLGLVQLALTPRRVRAYGYREDADDFAVRKGLLFRSLVVVPYGRMQYVDVNSGPLLRAFGLASITLHTASADTDTELPGVSAQEANRLRERLTERGEARLIEL